MTARIVGLAAILLSVVVSSIVLISLEMFEGPAGGYGNLHPAMMVFLLAPLLGLVMLAAAARKNASGRLTALLGGLPLLCQAVVTLFAFLRPGALA